jgi:hypothetical protein
LIDGYSGRELLPRQAREPGKVSAFVADGGRLRSVTDEFGPRPPKTTRWAMNRSEHAVRDVSYERSAFARRRFSTLSLECG